MTAGPAKRVVAVFTAFHPTRELIDNVNSVRRQVDAVIVVDDGSGDVAEPVLRELRETGSTVIALSSNSGIANALNVGLASPVAQEADFVATFDQDSAVPDRFIAGLVDEWARADAAGRRVAMVTPGWFAGFHQMEPLPRDGFVDAVEPIQSGALLSMVAFRQLGPFRSDFFIDLVDTEYFLRMKEAGWEALAASDLHLPHQLGKTYPIRAFGKAIPVFGKIRTISISTPFRYYYRVRNRVVLNRLYWRSARRLLRHDTVGEIRHYLIILTLTHNRLSLIRLMRMGLRDGRNGSLGRMPDSAAAVAAKISWWLRPLEDWERPEPRG